MALKVRKPLRGTQLNKSHPLPRGLIGCWMLNEATGSKVFDLSGHDKAGTLGGDGTLPVWTVTDKGPALYFAGNGFSRRDEIEIDGSSGLYGGMAELTVEILFRPLDADFFPRVIKGEKWVIVHDHVDDRVQFLVTPTGGNAWFWSSTNTAPLGEWCHAVLTWDGTYLRGYLNGYETSNSPASSSGSIEASTANVFIGSSGSGGDNFAGDIAFGRVYNRALSADEARWLAREPCAMFEAPQVPFYYEEAILAGGVYSATFEGISVSVAQDLFELVAPSNAGVLLCGVHISQSSEEGDAQDEQLVLAVKRGATTPGSGGAAITPEPLGAGGGVSASAVEGNNTTKATGGTIVTLHRESFNTRIGWAYRPFYTKPIILSPSQRLTVELVNAPTDAVTMDGTLIFQEIR